MTQPPCVSPTTRRRVLGRIASMAALPLVGCGTAYRRDTPPVPLRIATAAPGGGFALYGDALAKVLPERAGVALVLRATSGTTENLRLLAAGEVDLALAVMGVAFDAWRGQAAFDGKPLDRLRAVTPMYETAFHFMGRRDAAITSLQALHGRRLGVGPRGGTAELFLAALTAAAGVAPVPVHGTLSALTQQLVRREVDAVWFGAGLPIPAFRDAAAAADLVPFGLDEATRRTLVQRLPFFSDRTIAAGTYRGQTDPIEGVAVWNFVLAHADGDARSIESFTRAALAHRAALADIYAAAMQTDARHIGANSFLPFHPGALNAYNALGFGDRIAASLRKACRVGRSV